MVKCFVSLIVLVHAYCSVASSESASERIQVIVCVSLALVIHVPLCVLGLLQQCVSPLLCVWRG